MISSFSRIMSNTRNALVLKLVNVTKYMIHLSVKFHNSFSISGFFLFLVLFSQLYSGTMLAFSLIPECMLVPVSRDEEDMDDLYMDEFF
jgi:hypothetical protein